MGHTPHAKAMAGVWPGLSFWGLSILIVPHIVRFLDPSPLWVFVLVPFRGRSPGLDPLLLEGLLQVWGPPLSLAGC